MVKLRGGKTRSSRSNYPDEPHVVLPKETVQEEGSDSTETETPIPLSKKRGHQASSQSTPKRQKKEETDRKGKGPLLPESHGDDSEVETLTEGPPRLVVRPLTLDLNFLKASGAGGFVKQVVRQGWKDLLENKLNVGYNEDYVRAFYKSFAVVDDKITTVVEGTKIKMDVMHLSEIMGVPALGFSDYIQRKWPECSDLNPLEITKRFTGQAHRKKPLTKIDQKCFSPEQKLAFHLLWRTLIPRAQRRSTAHIRDLVYLELFVTEKPINLPALVFHHMTKVATEDSTHALPYASLITLILASFGVPMDLSVSLPVDRTNGPFLKAIHLETRAGSLCSLDKAEVKDEKVLKPIAVDWSNSTKFDAVLGMLGEISSRLGRLEAATTKLQGSLDEAQAWMEAKHAEVLRKLDEFQFTNEEVEVEVEEEATA